MAKSKLPAKHLLAWAAIIIPSLILLTVLVINLRPLSNATRQIVSLANPDTPTPMPSTRYEAFETSLSKSQINEYLNRPANEFLPLYQATVKFPRDGVAELVGKISFEKIVRFLYENDSGNVPPILNTIFKMLPSVSAIDLRCQLSVTDSVLNIKTEKLNISKINFNRPEFEPDKMVARLLGDSLSQLFRIEIKTLVIKSGLVYVSGRQPI